MIEQSMAVRQILYLKSVLAKAAVVDRISQEVLIVADNKCAQPGIALTFREFVKIEQHFFMRRHGAFAAALDRILLPFLGARVVKIAAAARGYAEIGLLDAGEHL